MQDYLPDVAATEEKGVEGKSVRLALSSWSFHCRAALTFKASIDRLMVDLLRLPWPDRSPREGSSSEAEEHVKRAWEAGYTGR